MFDSPVCMSPQVNVVSRFTKEDGGRGRAMFDSPACMSHQEACPSWPEVPECYP